MDGSGVSASEHKSQPFVQYVTPCSLRDLLLGTRGNKRCSSPLISVGVWHPGSAASASSQIDIQQVENPVFHSILEARSSHHEHIYMFLGEARREQTRHAEGACRAA